MTKRLLEPGDVLSSRYEIEKILGQGGMGAVYLARDTRIPTRWAVKEMADATPDPESVKAFEQEAHLLSTLKHPNLPRITDFFSENGKQYLVMDYVEGQTLEDILANRRLKVSEALDVAWQISDVLDYLHSHQPRPIVFRDLKPANIILTPVGTVKLIDFGIARFFQHDEGDTKPLGTPGYAAPEQYKGHSTVRSDIYALGATLYHALTGRDPSLAPFQFSPFQSEFPEVPVGLEAAVLKAVSLEPESRFATAKELNQAILALKEDPIAYQHMPDRLKTARLPPLPGTGFEPAHLSLGLTRRGQRLQRKVAVKGDVDGRLRSNASWLTVEPEVVRGRNPAVTVVVNTEAMAEGRRYNGELSLEGIRPLSVEVDIERAHVSFWSQALTFLLCLGALIPLLGYVATGVLGIVYMSTPRRERAAMRIFMAVAFLISVAWTVLFVLVGVGLTQLPWDQWFGG